MDDPNQIPTNPVTPVTDDQANVAPADGQVPAAPVADDQTQAPVAPTETPAEEPKQEETPAGV